MTGIDAVLISSPSEGVLFDLQIGSDGDILTEDQLDTAIFVSLFSDARASSYEIVKPQFRRGSVIDLELEPGESFGSKLWLLEQERLTPAVLVKAADFAKKSLDWMTRDQIASSVAARGLIDGQVAVLNIDLRKPNSRSESKFVGLWDNTGKR